MRPEPGTWADYMLQVVQATSELVLLLKGAERMESRALPPSPRGRPEAMKRPAPPRRGPSRRGRRNASSHAKSFGSARAARCESTRARVTQGRTMRRVIPVREKMEKKEPE